MLFCSIFFCFVRARSQLYFVQNNFIKTSFFLFLSLCFSNRIVPKRVNLRIEHVKHSNSRLDFLNRSKKNELLKKDAKEKNIRLTEDQLKRLVNIYLCIFLKVTRVEMRITTFKLSISWDYWFACQSDQFRALWWIEF